MNEVLSAVLQVLGLAWVFNFVLAASVPLGWAAIVLGLGRDPRNPGEPVDYGGQGFFVWAWIRRAEILRSFGLLTILVLATVSFLV